MFREFEYGNEIITAVRGRVSICLMHFDEDAFVHYLLYDVLVRKGTEVYYTYWVRQFLQEYEADNGDWQEQLGSFVLKMREGGERLEWQADQAEKAIRTFFTGFMKMSVADTVKEEPGETVGTRIPADVDEPLDAVRLLEQFRNELNLQHCGVGTEKTYVSRVKAYLEYQLQRGDGSGLEKKDMKKGVADYLAGLRDREGVTQSDRKQVFTALLIFFNLVVGEDISGLRYLLDKQ